MSEGTNIDLLEQVVSDQRQILTNVFNGTDVETIPQVWTLCALGSIHILEPMPSLTLSIDQEVLGYYVDGMRVPDDVTLLWADDTLVYFV